jgi:hypothetical protein
VGSNPTSSATRSACPERSRMGLLRVASEARCPELVEGSSPAQFALKQTLVSGFLHIYWSMLY